MYQSTVAFVSLGAEKCNCSSGHLNAGTSFIGDNGVLIDAMLAFIREAAATISNSTFFFADNRFSLEHGRSHLPCLGYFGVVRGVVLLFTYKRRRPWRQHSGTTCANLDSQQRNSNTSYRTLCKTIK